MKKIQSKNLKLKDKKIDEDYLNTLHDEGYELLEEGEAKKSLPFFEKILDYIIKNADTEQHALDTLDLYLDAMYHKGDALSDLGKNKEALKIFNDLLKTDHKDSDALFMKGYVLSDLKRDKEAVNCYKKYLKLEPRDSDALVNLSYCLMNLKKFHNAVRAAEKAIKIEPSNYDAWYNKAESLMEMGSYNTASVAFGRVIKQDSTDDEAWYMKARCLSKMGEKYADDAIDALLVAVSIEPTYKKKAKKEKDFSPIRKFKRFNKLVR